MSNKKKSQDLYLNEVYKQFIAIKDNDFKRAQEVFSSVFDQVKKKMGEQCNFFKKYSSQVMYGGSVYDGIKIKKLDEFDMDIVIRLPINYGDGENGIIIENDQPGFVKLKIINAFDNLDKQKEWEDCHKVTREWRDSEKYFLQNKFRRWMHSIIQKTLNVMDGKVTVNGVVYLLTYKESGPAYTLNIKNDVGDEPFVLDVDLVPVIRFMFPRSPKGYRGIEGVQSKAWLVVPKPNKAIIKNELKNRCWRLSFQEQEREFMRDNQALKQIIRLVKKLRDALEMKAIASYYIKTLFLWKVDEVKNDKTYWQGKVSVLFNTMVTKLHTAIVNKNIRYFWNENNNLIEGLNPNLQKVYSDKLKKVLNAIAANDADQLVSYLLTSQELEEFKKSDFYQKQCVLYPTPVADIVDNFQTLTAEINSLSAKYPKDKKIEEFENKMKDLADRLGNVEERLARLEMLERGRKPHDIFTDSENSMSDLLGGAKSLTLDDQPVITPTLKPLIDF